MAASSEELTATAEQSAQTANQVAIRLGERSKEIGQIVLSVKEIDGLSKEAAGEAQTVSAAIEQQSASMRKLPHQARVLLRWLKTSRKRSVIFVFNCAKSFYNKLAAVVRGVANGYFGS